MKIITSVVNPFFIELQYLSFKKFMKNEYEYIVFNDAKEYPDFTNGGDLTFKKQIEDKCKELNIKCINIENKIEPKYKNYPSYKHSLTLKIMHKFQLENPDKYIILDNDMFLINYLDINKYNGYKAAFVLMERNNDTIHYIWPGICYLDFTFPNHGLEKLDWRIVSDQTDVGGATMFWLRDQIQENEQMPTENQSRTDYSKNYNTKYIYFMRAYFSPKWNENNYPEYLNNYPKLLPELQKDIRNIKHNGNFTSDFIDNCYFHIRCGSNWYNDGINYYEVKSKKFKEIFDL